MQIKPSYRRYFAVAIAVLSIAGLNACSSSSTSAVTSGPLALSGTFASATSGAAFSIRNSKAFAVNRSEDFSVYTISCSTATVPPVTTTGSINSDGSFSLTIPNGLNVPLSCAVLDQSGDLVATLIVQDSSHKDVNGNPTVTNQPAFTSGSTKLGTISLDTVGLQALVSAASVVGATGASALSTGAAGTAFDPTGSYIIGDVSFTPPTGYRGTCTTAEQNNNTCNGPPKGQSIYLQRYKGTNTADGSAAYMLQVWQDQTGGNPKTAMQTCGSMIGLSSAQETTMGVSFSGAANDGVFTFATSVNDPNGSYPTVVNASNTPVSAPSLTGALLTNLFEISTAYTPYSIQGGTSITAYNQTGWAQGPDDHGYWNVGLGGGCVDANNNPVNATSWPSNCNSSPTAVPGETGFYSNSCTGSVSVQGSDSSVTATCTSVWGIFASASSTEPDLSNPEPQGTQFDWTYWNSNGVLAQNDQLCSTINTSTTAGQLAQLQCYANYYQSDGSNSGGNGQRGIEGLSGVCLPKIQTNFTATDPTKYIIPGHPPVNLVFMDQLHYPGASLATLLTQQVREDGIQLPSSGNGSQNWVPCEVVETDGLSVIPDPNNQGSYIATYASLLRTDKNSSQNPVCVANFNSAPATQFMFELTPN